MIARIVGSLLGGILTLAGIHVLGLGQARAEPGEPRPAWCSKQSCRAIEGRIRQAGGGQAISDATIVLIPAPPGSRPGPLREPPPPPESPAWLLQAFSDGEGEFRIEHLPHGFAWLIIQADGYFRIDQVIKIEDGRIRGLRRIFLKPDPNFPFRSTVQVARPEPANAHEGGDDQRILDPDLVRRLPGAFDDPIRALQVLPGIGRPPGGLSILAVRGLSPEYLRVEYAGVPIPRSHHILGLSTIVPTHTLKHVRLELGSASAASGSALAGQLLLEPRHGRQDGFHGRASIDILRATLSAEGPIGKGSFLIAARRGYADLILQPIYRQRDGGGLPLPHYHDAVGNFWYPLPDGRDLSFDVLGTGDRMRREIADITHPDGFRTVTQLRQQLWQGSARLRKSGDTHSFAHTVYFRWARDDFSYESWNGEQWGQAGRRMHWGLRSFLEIKPSRHLRWRSGVDIDIRAATHNDSGFTRYEEGTMESMRGPPLDRDKATTRLRVLAAVHNEFAWRTRALELLAGARLSWINLHGVHGIATQPRTRLTIFPHRHWRGSVSAGLHVVPHEPVDTIDESVFGTGLFPTMNGVIFLPDTLGTHLDPKAVIAPRSDGHPFQRGRKLGVSLVYDNRQAGPAPESKVRTRVETTGYAFDVERGAPQIMVPTGEGPQLFPHRRTVGVGVEFSFQLSFAERIDAIASYALAKTTERGWEDGRYPKQNPSDFDQRHVLSLAFAAKLPRNWAVGLRYRYATGLPHTPIVLAIRERDNYTGLRGPRNSDRLPPNHQLDLRVDKSWVLGRTKLSGYLDVQNVYNRKNAEGWLLSHDLERQLVPIALPILPTVGFSIEL